MKSKKDIENVQLTFHCPQDWDSMTVCNGGRFCNGCQKIVYDFTDKTQKDYEAVLRQHNGQICGRFSPQQMKPTSLWAKAATLAAFSLLGTEGCAQTLDSVPPHTIGEPMTTTISTDTSGRTFYLIAETPPEFEGGRKAMYKFLSDNIRYPQEYQQSTIEGKVYVGFIVETDGTLSNIKVKRGITGGIDKEAIRVVSLMSGRWKAGLQSGKPVRVAYTIPVKFSLE